MLRLCRIPADKEQVLKSRLLRFFHGKKTAGRLSLDGNVAHIRIFLRHLLGEKSFSTADLDKKLTVRGHSAGGSPLAAIILRHVKVMVRAGFGTWDEILLFSHSGHGVLLK